MFEKIRYRLFLSNLLVLALVLTGFAFVVRLVFIRNLKQQQTEQLIALAQAAAASTEFDRGYLESEAKFSLQQLKDRQQAFQWFDSQGKLVEQQGDRLYIPTLPLEDEQTVQTQTDKIRLQVVTLPIIGRATKRSIGYIRVSQSLEEVDETISRLDVGLAVGAIVAIVLSSLGSSWLNHQAMQPIEESFERLKQFTADASHELRSPLMAISTNAEVALTYAEGMRASDGEKFQAIASAIDQMSKLTEDLLLLARTDRVSDSEFKRVNLTTLLTALVNLYKPQAQAKQIELKTKIDNDLWLMGDEAKLTRAFTNVIQNAIQYTSDGGEVQVIGDRIEGEIKVTVADTGIGISREHLELVFERLWRADGSRSYYEGGSGLGLAITQGIIRNHRGTITVTSQLNVGSRFVVCLPASAINLNS
ncbi:MAG: HAMP domain-containing sensor histidine kinase [Spirulinaceae cyanobacterium]